MNNSYRKYTWASNKIEDEDMSKLYQLKQKTGKPITILVKEAVKEYIENNGGKLE